MTDGDTAHEPGGRTGPARSTLMVVGGLAFVLLAAIGATGGWLLAGADDGQRRPAAAPTPTASRTAAPSDARPTSTPSPTWAPRTSAAATAPSSGPTVPPVVGLDFEKAREELRERRLGWRLVFGSGIGSDVERASPAVGEPISPGRTVTLYVRGPAPAQEVPDVVGESCAEAADELVDDGFYPAYRTGKTGLVGRQEPVADSPARWNDQVAIWCGLPASGTPDPTP